jgi:hypothetical protein
VIYFSSLGPDLSGLFDESTGCEYIEVRLYSGNSQTLCVLRAFAAI